MDIYPYLAVLAYAILLVGFALRHRGSLRHAWLMGTGMALDLGLVLTLELTRDAIATVLHKPLSVPQLLHVGSSTLAVTFYVPTFGLGLVRLLRPTSANVALRTWHRRFGYTALAFRTVGFLFLASMLSLAHG